MTFDPVSLFNGGQLSAGALRDLAEQAVAAQALDGGSGLHVFRSPAGSTTSSVSSDTPDGLTTEYTDSTGAVDPTTTLQFDPNVFTLSSPSAGVQVVSLAPTLLNQECILTASSGGVASSQRFVSSGSPIAIAWGQQNFGPGSHVNWSTLDPTHPTRIPLPATATSLLEWGVNLHILNNGPAFAPYGVILIVWGYPAGAPPLTGDRLYWSSLLVQSDGVNLTAEVQVSGMFDPRPYQYLEVTLTLGGVQDVTVQGTVSSTGGLLPSYFWISGPPVA